MDSLLRKDEVINARGGRSLTRRDYVASTRPSWRSSWIFRERNSQHNNQPGAQQRGSMIPSRNYRRPSLANASHNDNVSLLLLVSGGVTSLNWIAWRSVHRSYVHVACDGNEATDDSPARTSLSGGAGVTSAKEHNTRQQHQRAAFHANGEKNLCDSKLKPEKNGIQRQNNNQLKLGAATCEESEQLG